MHFIALEPQQHRQYCDYTCGWTIQRNGKRLYSFFIMSKMALGPTHPPTQRLLWLLLYPSHPPWFCNPNNISVTSTDHKAPRFTQFFPVSCPYLPLRPQHLHQHPTLNQSIASYLAHITLQYIKYSKAQKL